MIFFLLHPSTMRDLHLKRTGCGTLTANSRCQISAMYLHIDTKRNATSEHRTFLGIFEFVFFSSKFRSFRYQLLISLLWFAQFEVSHGTTATVGANYREFIETIISI